MDAKLSGIHLRRGNEHRDGGEHPQLLPFLGSSNQSPPFLYVVSQW